MLCQEDLFHSPLGLKTTVAASIPPITQKKSFRFSKGSRVSPPLTPKLL